MSVKVQALIWEIAPYRGNTLLAFLALGDWSDDDGVCWPKMPSLARKSRQSLRSAQYAIELMCADGFIAVQVNPGRGNENEFKINMQKLHDLFRAGKNMQIAPKHAKRDIAIRKNRQEPSVKPPYPLLKKSNQKTVCDLHPDSGRTQWGTCWGCYAEKYGAEATV